jgi:uncharacterized repeat protein (TIGR03803 family)
LKSLPFPILLAALLSASSVAQTFKILHTFAGTPDGAGPTSIIRENSTGTIYGVTFGGGATGNGTVFKITRAGNEAVIYSFGAAPDGNFPESITADAAHNLYGVTQVGGASNNGTVFKIDPSGSETILYSFAGGADGRLPFGRLIRDSDGNLYGTTLFGGTSCDCGTVFKLDPSGNKTVLYTFTGVPDGASPTGALIGDSKGNLYGTTQYGGIIRDSVIFCSGVGCGTVFKLTRGGDESVLYRFAARPNDGIFAISDLILDSAGNLYGVTSAGGMKNGITPQGLGTVFKLDPSGHETTLYAFKGKFDGGDGNIPEGGVVRDSAGNFYGVTAGGGTDQRGTIYKLDPFGNETVLYTFTNGADGEEPTTRLVIDPAGNLFGASSGGAGKSGLVFEFTP